LFSFMGVFSLLLHCHRVISFYFNHRRETFLQRFSNFFLHFVNNRKFMYFALSYVALWSILIYLISSFSITKSHVIIISRARITVKVSGRLDNFLPTHLPLSFIEFSLHWNVHHLFLQIHGFSSSRSAKHRYFSLLLHRIKVH
jgi:hypothetical protein